ncbi:Hypothetical predicted protein [Pelobates cultripes]|uniref:Uncharacterized protein n=1 Tax=Pelobates cultripes TaxID=61616 RepID=A0AAD1VJW2_PELCU|nr:Hypothetical predicted protein [Pelobates cultripes]
MVHTKKQSVSGTSAADSPRRYTGPMDGYMASQPEARDIRPPDKMAPATPERGNPEVALSDGDPPLHRTSPDLSPRILSKTDTGKLAQEIRAALREELGTDLASLEGRMDEVEAAAHESTQQHQATEVAVTRQGTLLLTLRRQVEDLQNRSRRNNIRVRGLPEADAAPLATTLEALFRQVLGADAPPELHLMNAHRALGPPRQDGSPKDVICCLRDGDLNEQIMNAARGKMTIRFRDADISLFQDLIRNWITKEVLAARQDPLAPLHTSGTIPQQGRWGGPAGAE